MIAGAGFAVMAWRLAQTRTHSGVCYPNDIGPDPVRRPLSTREYYRIVDKADACWAQRNAAFMGGTVTGPYRCAL